MGKYDITLKLVNQFQLSPKVMMWLCIVLWWFVFSFDLGCGLDSLFVLFEAIKVNHHSFTSVAAILYSVGHIGEAFNDNKRA